MFGGFGEPTAHPRILDMIRAVKALGLRVEMTTNATLLDDALIDGLLRERLDTLWISLDGTTEESFETIRPGASLAASWRISSAWPGRTAGTDTRSRSASPSSS